VTRSHDPLLEGADPGALARLGSLAGYECDGYSYTSDMAVPDGRDGCPADFTVLAYAALPHARPDGPAPSAPGWLAEEREQTDSAPRVAAVGYLRRGRLAGVQRGDRGLGHAPGRAAGRQDHP